MPVCTFCEKDFFEKCNLTKHQKTSKYCIKIQLKVDPTRQIEHEKNICEFCNKQVTTKDSLKKHMLTCKIKKEKDSTKISENLFKKEIELSRLNEHNLKQEIESTKYELYKLKSTMCHELKNDKVQQDIELKSDTINILNDLNLRKQRRIKYEERNVIYIITIEEKNRVYIIGKSTNLTNRLSTYNKSHEHKVVYYKSCKNRDEMDVIENMVLTKLSDYRERSNRDRFILPIDKDISFFTNTIDRSIEFFVN
jgi:hypothetical protein